ncbi:S53 family peptidase [Actinomadura harenae]|uniref:Peptidase S53 domain-containing protein n=1 Tax=Actinomadura harenae TaxID=2483351 RepID=A0A3M2M6T6_9ACTN|nr:hypothetical protein [Actinomadura harenae]RMI42808.1 hypothetical protein EBO15_18380 [Actinomadura harenae]
MNRARLPVAASAAAFLCASLISAAPAHAAAPATPERTKVLLAALANMRTNYAKFADDAPGPQDVFDYRVDQLWKRGIDGTGTTVAVLEGWEDPNIAQVVHTFDQRYGLPDPQIKTIYPAGKLPAQCPPGMVKLGSYGSCDAWAGELELDVVSAHLMAPYAKIVISATPADTEANDDDASQVAMPEIMRAAGYIGSHHLADVMSVSDGNGESSYSHGVPEVRAQDPGALTAAMSGVPLLGSTGDCGVVQNLPVAAAQCGNTSSTPDSATWDDSPWVTAVGGSVPNLDKTGKKAGPDPVWNVKGYTEGAGFSKIYKRPAYQDPVASATGSPMRWVPDLTMDGQNGTSQSAPTLAGVLALASQLNHGPLGPINPALYALGRSGAKAGIEDVVSGDNTLHASNGTVIPGFSAAPGFDRASGWGTLDAATFVPSLVRQVQQGGETRAARDQARRELTGLQRAITFTRNGTKVTLTASGFLPGHPVTLRIDGRSAGTLTAGDTGTVTTTVDAGAPGAARHVVDLSSMLITVTGRF